METILGSDLMLFEKEGQGENAVYKTFAMATTCTLNVAAGVLETSSKDSGKWTDKKAGKLSWTASTDNLYTEDNFSRLFEKMVARSKILIAFDLASNANNDSGIPSGGWTIANGGFEGEAIITQLTANAPDGENATYTVNFEGSGELKPRKQ